MSHNTWIHRAVRHVVRPLVGTAVTPNHLTSLRLVSGLSAALCLALNSITWLWIGCGLFVVSMLLDRADGELARLSGKSSTWGRRFDTITDAICNATVLIGTGFGLRGGPLGDYAIVMGTVAGAAVASIFWMMLEMEATHGVGSAQFEATAGFDPDDAVILIPTAMLLGWGSIMLTAAVICAPLAGLIIYWQIRRRLHH